MAFAARPRDEVPELLDTRMLVLDPLGNTLVDLLAPAVREKLDPQLLEIADKPGRQQALPLVGRNEPHDLLVRPVEAKCLAEPRVGSRCLELVDPGARC